MSYSTYIVSRRNGTRSGVAPGSVRVCVTLKEPTFLALRDRADAQHHTLSGEAADILARELVPAGDEQP